jgi:hypothetical protein
MFKPQNWVNVHITMTDMEATPVNATIRVASTRSVKFLRNHVPTPQTAMSSHSKYHAGGYAIDSMLQAS